MTLHHNVALVQLLLLCICTSKYGAAAGVAGSVCRHAGIAVQAVQWYAYDVNPHWPVVLAHCTFLSLASLRCSACMQCTACMCSSGHPHLLWQGLQCLIPEHHHACVNLLLDFRLSNTHHSTGSVALGLRGMQKWAGLIVEDQCSRLLGRVTRWAWEQAARSQCQVGSAAVLTPAVCSC